MQKQFPFAFFILRLELHVVWDLKQEISSIKFHNQWTCKMVFDICHGGHVHVIPSIAILNLAIGESLLSLSLL